MSENRINVTFAANGAALTSFIESVQQKSAALTANAIKNAQLETSSSKEQLRIITQQISALERKNALESQASRLVLGRGREEALSRNRDEFEGRKNEIFGNKSLTENEKKEKITALEGSEKSGADKIKNDYRENLLASKEQARESRLQTQLSRESIQTAKEAARETIRSIQVGDKTLASVYESVGHERTEEEGLTLGLIEEGLRGKKSNEDREEPTKKKESIFGSILGVENLNAVTGGVSQLAQTKNGFDVLPAIGEMTGTITGTLLGMLFGQGEATGKVTGMAAKAAAEFLRDKALAREDLGKARNRYNAITGSDPGIADTEKIGVGITQFMQQQSDYARKRGYGAESLNTTREALYAEKGFGVDQSTSAGLIEIQRSSKESNRDLAKLISGIAEKGRGGIFQGNDMTFMNELIGRFSNLQREMLKTSETVPTGLTMDILNKFNSVGGAWSARDPRSAGYINTVQESLSEPGSDNMRALGYRILAEANPNMTPFDLREEMQKGIAAKGYLSGVLKYVDRVGGDEKQNLAGAFPGLPLSAVRRLYENREGLENGSLSMDELQAKFPIDFKARAEARTNTLEKNTAEVANGQLKDTFGTVGAMADAIQSAIKASLSGAVITMENGKMVLAPASVPAPKQNKTRNPYDKDAQFGPGWKSSGDPYQ
jgi:hypothetical protein